MMLLDANVWQKIIQKIKPIQLSFNKDGEVDIEEKEELKKLKEGVKENLENLENQEDVQRDVQKSENLLGDLSIQKKIEVVIDS